MSASPNSLEQLQTMALVGAPNSGKTTLYNWLTNSRFRTMNYPGATVEYSVGSLASHWGHQAYTIDTPGVYSLHPKSADEEITLKALFEKTAVGSVQSVVVVVDGTQLSRHLLLVEQIQESGFPFIIAITMADILRKEKIEIDTDYLQEVYKAPVVLVDGILGGGVKDLIQSFTKLDQPQKIQRPSDQTLKAQEERQEHIDKIAQRAQKNDPALNEKFSRVRKNTNAVDQVLLHPFFGFLFFIMIMTALFASIFWVAAPFMDWVDGAFSWAADASIELLGETSLLGNFLGNGLIAGFGAVLVFVPQIFILFVGISILEASGYLARAATIIDKPFSKLGLSGRSFVPVLSGFACAVPALIASRNIPSPRDRWITHLIIPLMTCSARLPVYALLLAFVFQGHSPWIPGLVLASLYLGSLVMGALAAGIVNRYLPKKEPTFFMMELPLYRRPRAKVVLQEAFQRTLSYVKRAGPVIFVISVFIWIGSTFPNYQMENVEQKLQSSYLAQAGKVMEPVFQPMGVDWRVGVGLISAFAAREVFVSTLAIVFNITAEDEDSQQASLLANMRTATDSQGDYIFTGASVAGLLIFFMIALQCMSTVAVAIRESGSWTFGISQMIAFNLVAYILAVAIYQIFKNFPGMGPII